MTSYLIHDAWRDLYDVALVFSQDTDLLEPLRLVKDEIGKQVGVVVLDGKPAGRLAQVAHFTRHLTPQRLKAAQLPDILMLNRGKQIRRPPSW